jgi:hypothetical protein
MMIQAVAGVVFYARLSHHMPSAFPLEGKASLDLKKLASIQSLDLKWEVLHVISSSIQVRLREWHQCIDMAEHQDSRQFGPSAPHVYRSLLR